MTKKRGQFLLIGSAIGLLFFGLSAISFAQYGGTRAGAVGQELEQKAPAYKPFPKEETLFKLERPEEEFSYPEDLKIFVKEIQLSGNSVIPTEELNKIISKYHGRELTFKELKEMTAALEGIYHDRGYFLASVYLPEQEIQSGILKIVILEGKIGKVLVKDNKFYNQEFLRKHFHADYKGVIHYGRFVKSIMLLNENTDCEVRATLVKGKERGTSDVVLSVKDKLPLHLSYAFNNFGDRYISKRRNDYSISYSNLIAAGDTLAFRLVYGDPFNRLKFAHGEYSWFINSYGTKLRFSYDWLEFDSGRELRQLLAGGKSKIYSTEITHPLIRNRNTNADAGIGFDYKQVYDYLGIFPEPDSIISDDELRVLKLKFKVDHLDNFSGRSYLLGMVSFGFPDIMGALKKDDPRWSSRLGAGGEFQKINLAFVRVQKMPFSSYMILKVNCQYASDDLTVPEQMAIGGADSVRGYPQSEYLGDQGYEASAELRVPPPFVGNIRIPFLGKRIKDVVQIIGFIDNAAVYYKHYTSSFGEQHHEQITGAGAGLRFNFPWDITARIDCGFPVGSTEPSDGANAHVYFEISKKLF